MKSALKGSPADEHSVLERANGSPMSHSQSFRFANEKDSFNSRYSTPRTAFTILHLLARVRNMEAQARNKQRNTFSFNAPSLVLFGGRR